MPTPNIKFLALKSPNSAPAFRTLAEHLGDVLNVKSFGAAGDFSANDTTAIQTCFDTAFGGSLDIAGASSPHGSANAHLNRAVFFPPGRYKTTAPLILTDVYGARIYGSGRWTTQINNVTGGSTCLVTNGFSQCLLSDIELNGDSIALDLDWDNSGVGLSHNLFENVEFNANAVGARVAHSGYEGHGNQFLHCSVGADVPTVYIGWLIEGANADANHICGGNTNTALNVAIKCTGGSVHVQTISFQTSSTCDVYVSSGKPCSVIGCRTESPNFFIGIGTGTPTNGRAFISGCSHLLSGTLANLTNFKLIMDACSSGDQSGSNPGGVLVGDSASFFYSRGSVYTRDGSPSNDFYSGFAGTHSAGSGTPWYVI